MVKKLDENGEANTKCNHMDEKKHKRHGLESNAMIIIKYNKCNYFDIDFVEL